MPNLKSHKFFLKLVQKSIYSFEIKNIVVLLPSLE